MRKLLLFLSIWLSSYAMFAQNFPFPQVGSLSYANGIIASNPDNNKIQSLYQSWYSKFYSESGNLGRIKFDDEQYTVSEGIGYGMLIFVYMDNTTNDTQDEFDKLYNYYNKFGNKGNEKYLMSWKIEGFTSVAPSSACGGNSCGGSATDGDLDVALALLLAHKQWGSTGTINYIQEAENLLKYIYDEQVDAQKLMKPGHHWEGQTNPCYFTTASIGLFDQAQSAEGFSTTRNWSAVYSTSQTYLTNVQSTKGLFPDWASQSITPTASSGDRGNFSWDACRTPWRIAWDYAWYGNSKALDMLDKTIAFNETQSPGSVAGPLSLSGSSIGEAYHNAAFIGGLGSAYMGSSSHQADLDAWYKELKNVDVSYGYYAPTLQILYLLTMSGNSPNFYEASSGPVAPRIGSATNDPTASSEITLTFSKELSSVSSTVKSSFSAKVNGSSATISSLDFSTSSPKEIVLTLGTTVEAGDEITLSYSGTSIKSKEGAALEAFSNLEVSNLLTNGFVLADCENEEHTNLGTGWYTYNDKDPGGNSSIDPLTTDDDPFVMTAGGAAGTANAAKIVFNIDAGSLEYDGFVGMGFHLNEDETPYDLSEATGIAFWHKGSNCYFEITLSTIEDDCNFSFEVSSHDDWTLVEVPFTDMEQYSWGDPVSWDASKISKLQWKPQKANSTSDEELWIDEVVAMDMEGTPVVVKTELTALIKTVEDFLADAVEGSSDGEYPSGSKAKLQKAADAAQTVVDNADATQSDVSTAINDLEDAFGTFKSSVNGVNKSELTALIKTVEDFLADAVEGSSYGEYPSGSKSKLQKAADAAQTVADNANATQSEVNTAVQNLENAFSTFKSSVNDVNKAALEKLIATVEAKLASATEGTNKGDYPVGSKATLQNAVDDAQAVVDNSSASQSKVDSEAYDLQSAYDTFLNSKITTEPSGATLIADCENENAGNQTKLGTYWYSYAAGSSTIDPLSTATSPFSVTAAGANGTDSAAVATGKLVNTGKPDYESAGIGFPLNEDESDYDLTGATGISFWHKGDECIFVVMLSTVEQDAGKDHQITIPAHSNWTLVEVPFADLEQASWVTDVVTFDPSKVTKMQWQVKDGTARSYSIGVDEVSVMGLELDIEDPTVDPENPTDKNTLVANGESHNNGSITNLGTYWYSYAAGSSTIDPLSTATSPFSVTAAGANGTDSAAVASGKLVNTGKPDYESAGIGFPLNEDESDYDLTGATGISFWHKGDECVFVVMLSTVEQDAGKDHQITIPAHSDWTLVEVPFSDLEQASWVTDVVAFDPSKVTKMQWQVKDGLARDYTIGIDEVTVLGLELDLPTIDIDRPDGISAESIGLKIYPVPVQNELTVKANGIVSVSIFNTQGIKVLESFDTEINVEQLASGLYSVIIKTDKGSVATTINKK